MADLKVGGKIWKLKPSIPPRDGTDAFTNVEIVDETSRSWIVGHPEFKWGWEKVPKKGPHPGFAFTLDEAEDLLYGRSSWILSEEIRRVSDPKILRQIADLIGWKPKGVR